MQLKIQKLDRRFDGFPTWTHRAMIEEGYKTRVYNFHKLREQCWDSFGPSCSKDELVYIRNSDPTYSPVWAWFRDQYKGACYIYFKGDEPITSWLLVQA